MRACVSSPALERVLFRVWTTIILANARWSISSHSAASQVIYTTVVYLDMCLRWLDQARTHYLLLNRLNNKLLQVLRNLRCICLAVCIYVHISLGPGLSHALAAAFERLPCAILVAALANIRLYKISYEDDLEISHPKPPSWDLHPILQYSATDWVLRVSAQNHMAS